MLKDSVITIKDSKGEIIFKDTLWGLVFFFALSSTDLMLDNHCKLYLNNNEVKRPPEPKEG